MLGFFRKYQKYFFMVITVVIIFSFSFFGTYNTIGATAWRDQIAFTAINGKEISRLDVDEMAMFLATDSEDKLLYGGAWGPNFLNDGVIRKDFLETGLAQELAQTYITDLNSELQARLEKEKRYSPYIHPQAKFISASQAWSYFAPEIKNNFQLVRTAKNPQDAFNAKVKLFLAEKSFPSPLLRQVLRYQEKQQTWINPDPGLDQVDLSLFGYHTVEDWFGSHFTRLVSQFIINTAIMANDQGYEVSKAEALADLMRNAEISYQQNIDRPNLGVKNVSEYFTEQLHLLNMDQARAVKIWSQVLLFRRYFHDAGGSAFVDNLPTQQFNGFTKETVELDVYRLPPELRIGEESSLQKFEIYLNAVSKRNKEGSLELPKAFLSATEVSKNYPELVQKRVLVEIAQVNKKDLQPKVSIRETWNWEAEDKNWATLKTRFPDLGVQKGTTRDERFAALDNLDPIIRAKVDAFARSSIVDSHPEWIQTALNTAPAQKKVLALRSEGGEAPLSGLDSKEKRQAFIKLIDQATLKEKPQAASPLNAYTADQQWYYQITVLERDAQPEVMTFAEANSKGSLDQVKDAILEKYYIANREKTPLLYQKPDQKWRDFSEVHDLVAHSYFEKVMSSLQQEYKSIVKNPDTATLGKDRAASVRFYVYLKDAEAKLKKDPKVVDQYVRKGKTQDSGLEHLSAPEPLASQWLLLKEKVQINRTSHDESIDSKEAFSLAANEWSNIKTPANGDLVFFQVLGRPEADDAQVAIQEQTERTYALLSADAQRILMKNVLKEIQAKQAISLSYLNAQKI